MEKRDDIISRELRINMQDRNDKSRIEHLFENYHTILHRNGLSWIMKEKQKVSIYHVLSPIRPTSLRSHLESDLDFSYYDLWKNFLGFMKHAICLSKSLDLVDNGGPQSFETQKIRRKSRGVNRSEAAETSTRKFKLSSNLRCAYMACTRPREYDNI